ncbi:MAG: hypothetical protein UU47_C0025G0006 [candidate division TM6 bacterium GW2011_GWE2_41_16]|nr:MAG: hypothetical protein UU47_C0025G0006 [candidate division TM6 bacterium GW2011_GWE2_41_16]
MNTFIQKIVSSARELSSFAILPLISVAIGCLLFFTGQASVYESFVYPAMLVALAVYYILLCAFSTRVRNSVQAAGKTWWRYMNLLSLLIIAGWLITLYFKKGFTLGSAAPFNDINTFGLFLSGIMFIVIGNYLGKISKKFTTTIDLSSKSIRYNALMLASNKTADGAGLGYALIGFIAIVSVFFLPYRYAFMLLQGMIYSAFLVYSIVMYIVYRRELAKLQK